MMRFSLDPDTAKPLVMICVEMVLPGDCGGSSQCAVKRCEGAEKGKEARDRARGDGRDKNVNRDV
jgi:hypothetical protein